MFKLAKKLEEKGLIILPFVLIFFSLIIPSVLSDDVNVSVLVCSPCPGGYYYDEPGVSCHCASEQVGVRVMVGLLPLMTGIGIIFWLIRGFYGEEILAEKVIKLVITIIVAVVLLAVLVATI